MHGDQIEVKSNGGFFFEGYFTGLVEKQHVEEADQCATGFTRLKGEAYPFPLPMRSMRSRG
jgi:hypothetical protein